MLYPNLVRQFSFSTTYMERGGHSGKDGRMEAMQGHKMRTDIDPLKTVPLLKRPDFLHVANTLTQLPPYSALPTFDLYHRRRHPDLLLVTGFSFTEGLRWWGAQRAKAERCATRTCNAYASDAKYRQLASVWSGIPAAERGCAADYVSTTSNEMVPRAAKAAELQSWAEGAGLPSLRDDKYLVYQPTGGFGEWLISLRNAVGLADVLKRTLVVPHIMWDGTRPVAYSDVFDAGPLREVVPNLMLMDEFLQLGLTPSRILLRHVKDPRLLPARR